jgi:hypothetical protein
VFVLTPSSSVNNSFKNLRFIHTHCKHLSTILNHYRNESAYHAIVPLEWPQTPNQVWVCLPCYHSYNGPQTPNQVWVCLPCYHSYNGPQTPNQVCLPCYHSYNGPQTPNQVWVCLPCYHSCNGPQTPNQVCLPCYHSCNGPQTPNQVFTVINLLSKSFVLILKKNQLIRTLSWI